MYTSKLYIPLLTKSAVVLFLVVHVLHVLNSDGREAADFAASRDYSSDHPRIGFISMMFGTDERPYVRVCMESFARKNRLYLITENPLYQEWAQSFSNVKVKFLTLDDLIRQYVKLLCTEYGCSSDSEKRSELETVITASPRKHYLMSELKVVYAALFQDLIRSYAFYAWIDLDIILGDTQRMFPYDEIKGIDVLVFGQNLKASLYTAGQMTVFRNSKRI